MVREPGRPTRIPDENRSLGSLPLVKGYGSQTAQDIIRSSASYLGAQRFDESAIEREVVHGSPRWSTRLHDSRMIQPFIFTVIREQVKPNRLGAGGWFTRWVKMEWHQKYVVCRAEYLHSPHMVTRFLSPPKDAMFSWIHLSAKRWSCIPAFVLPSARSAGVAMKPSLLIR